MTRPGFDAAILAYPWSVLEQGSAAARRHVGEAVGFSLAAAYHSLRQLDPLSDSPVCELPDAAVYWSPSAGSFPRGSLSPVLAPGALRDSYSRARAELGRFGARVGAWVSVLHSTALASAHPESALTIATGDVLRHALCPAAPEARDYAVALVGDLVARERPDFLELEATGFHGWRHDSRHDKVAIDVSDELNHLLSVCFCPACCGALADLGGDPERIRDGFRRALRRVLRGEDRGGCPDPADLELVDEARRKSVVALTASLVAVAEGIPVLIHAGPEPRRTGSRAALGADSVRELPAPVDVVVSTDGLGHDATGDAVARAVDHYADTAGVVVSRRVWAPDVSSGEQLAADVAGAVARGARGVRFHTYGLLDEERLGWIRSGVEGVS